MAGPFWGDHQDVKVLARLDQVEMHVEAVREHQGRALLHVGSELVAIDVGLQLVRRQHHHDVRPFRGFGDGEDLDALLFGLGGGGGALAERHGDLLHAGIPEVEGVGVALAAVADDDDLLALDQVDVGVAIVIDAHGRFVPSRSGAIAPRLAFSAGARAPSRFSAAACSEQSSAGKVAGSGNSHAGAAPRASPGRGRRDGPWTRRAADPGRRDAGHVNEWRLRPEGSPAAVPVPRPSHGTGS